MVAASGLGIIAVKTNKEETAFELKRHWLKLVQGVAWTDQEKSCFFSSVFFLVGGGFFLVFVLAVVSVCVRHVYKSQSASHSPFFHLLATLLPSPEQARPIVWGCVG